MKNIIVLFFFIIFNVTNFSEVWANLNNSIIVKVDKKIITNFEVKNKILRTLIISGNEINQLNINNLKKQTLDSLINLKLKEIELENVDLKINKKRIDSYINLISKNKPQELKSKLNNYNLDFDLFLKEIETELKWQQFIFKKYSNRIKIDEVFIEKEVEKIFSSQVKNYEVNLSEIEIFHNNNKTNNELISEIQNEIKDNGFDNTAIKFSISNTSTQKGNLGWLSINSLSEKIRAEINNVEIGQVSKPIIQTNSILFLKLNSKRETEIDKTDKIEFKDNFIRQKRNEMFNLFSNSHLSKLKTYYLVEYL